MRDLRLSLISDVCSCEMKVEVVVDGSHPQGKYFEVRRFPLLFRLIRRMRGYSCVCVSLWRNEEQNGRNGLEKKTKKKE